MITTSIRTMEDFCNCSVGDRVLILGEYGGVYVGLRSDFPAVVSRDDEGRLVEEIYFGLREALPEQRPAMEGICGIEILETGSTRYKICANLLRRAEEDAD